MKVIRIPLLCLVCEKLLGHSSICPVEHFELYTVCKGCIENQTVSMDIDEEYLDLRFKGVLKNLL